MTPQEQKFVDAKLEEAKNIAYDLGEEMFAKTKDVGVSVHASCLLYASTCFICAVPLESAIELMRRMYDQMLKELPHEGSTQ